MIISSHEPITIMQVASYLYCDNPLCQSRCRVPNTFQDTLHLPIQETPENWLAHRRQPPGECKYYCSPVCAYEANKPLS